jgi:protein tyrosine/serine phosphatase
MRSTRVLARGYLTAAIIAALLPAQLIAQSNRTESTPAIRIENFGRVNDNYYRGAQPHARDYADLAALGIKTVIDLEHDGESNEQQLVEAAGMKFYRVGMSTQSRPTTEQLDRVLSIVEDARNQPVFVHCHGGRHRTGIVTAVYRMKNDGWPADRAFAEMKQYQFDKGFGHGALKDYVFEYSAQLARVRAAQPVGQTAAGSGIR